ncbi:hypothetical protein GQ600_21981 [Phytophthora cactorum]|nr:hypothetical protein GQ600_21981 [Phytophthora cactorum]
MIERKSHGTVPILEIRASEPKRAEVEATLASGFSWTSAVGRIQFLPCGAVDSNWPPRVTLTEFITSNTSKKLRRRGDRNLTPFAAPVF